MRNIGILTYHSVANFGANLQALSTFYFLKKRGYNPLVIDYVPDKLEKKDKRLTPENQYNIHQQLCKNRLVMTAKCRDAEDIAKVIKDNAIEGVIIGSDAVAQHHTWKSRLLFPSKTIVSVLPSIEDQMCPNPFWGTFNDKLEKPIPLAMMSVSNQNSNYKLMTKKEKETMGHYASQMVYISTRDQRTSDMIKMATKGHVEPSVTPDPVFAFNENVDFQISEEEIRSKYNLRGKYILLCFDHPRNITQEWLADFMKLAKEKDLECVALPLPGGISFCHPFEKEIPLPLNPLDWYALIKYSSGYVGCNMHPIVVSLSNAVPCCSFDNYGIAHFRVFIDKKGSKIYHIMNEFGVADNRYRARGLFQETPSPDCVLSQLEKFPREQVRLRAAEYLERYKKMMHDIETALSRKI